MKLESIKNEQTGLEKLEYLYKESDDVYNAISSTEKQKRIKAINAFVADAKETQLAVTQALGAGRQAAAGASGNEEPREMQNQRINNDRDEDGELLNTKGVDNT